MFWRLVFVILLARAMAGHLDDAWNNTGGIYWTADGSGKWSMHKPTPG